MYTPNTISLLCLAVCIVWTTAGFTLLLYSGRSHSRPDFMAGLGLVLGGTLTGLCSTPIAGQGVFPLESIIFGLCCLWCFGFGETDEATALQVGDRWAPSLAMGSLALVNFLLIDRIGAQPVLLIFGAELRPFELVIAGLFGYLWLRSLSLPESFFSHLPRRHASCIMFAAFGASLAGLFGGAYADLGRFGILAIGPLPYLLVGIRGRHLAHILAVSLSMALACLSLTYAFHNNNHRTVIQEIQTSVVEMALHYSELHEPLQQAVDTRDYLAPEMRYAELSTTLTRDLEQLTHAARQLPQTNLEHAVQLFAGQVSAHRHWSRELFETKTSRLLEQARHAYIDGNAALADLQRELVATNGILGVDSEQLSRLALALLAILGMLGAALLRAQTDQSPPTQMFYVHLDPPRDLAAADRAAGAQQSEPAPLR